MVSSGQRLQPNIGVGVLVYNPQQQILLGQRLNSHGAETWGAPGGHLDFGETFEECAIRETLEETGLVITNPRFYTVTNDIFQQENKHYVTIFMTVALSENQEVINLEPDKTLEWKWFNKNNLPRNLFLPIINLIKLGYLI